MLLVRQLLLAGQGQGWSMARQEARRRVAMIVRIYDINCTNRPEMIIFAMKG